VFYAIIKKVSFFIFIIIFSLPLYVILPKLNNNFIAETRKKPDLFFKYLDNSNFDSLFFRFMKAEAMDSINTIEKLSMFIDKNGKIDTLYISGWSFHFIPFGKYKDFTFQYYVKFIKSGKHRFLVKMEIDSISHLPTGKIESIYDRNDDFYFNLKP
jgi:hypothetical protein